MSLIMFFICILIISGAKLSEKGSRIQTSERWDWAEKSAEDFKSKYLSKSFEELYFADRSDEKKRIVENTRIEMENKLGTYHDAWVNALIYARYGFVLSSVAEHGIPSMVAPKSHFYIGDVLYEKAYCEEQNASFQFALWYEREAIAHGIEDRLVYVPAPEPNLSLMWDKNDPRACNYVTGLQPTDIEQGRYIWKQTVYFGRTRDLVNQIDARYFEWEEEQKVKRKQAKNIV